jgi:hypothetical protein
VKPSKEQEMPTRKEMIQGGLYIQEAVATAGAFETGVDLTGKAGQGARYLIASNTVITTTVSGTGDSITLPPGDQGDWVQIVNYSANAVKVYPPVGWKIHNGAVNAAYTIAANKTAIFTQITDPNVSSVTQEYFGALSA